MSNNKLNVKNSDTLHALLEVALQQFENKESSTGSNVLQAMVGMQVISTLDSLEPGWRAMSEKIEMAAAEKIKQLSVENQKLNELFEFHNVRGKHQVDFKECCDEVDRYNSDALNLLPTRLIDALKQFNPDTTATPKNPVHGHDDGFLSSLFNDPGYLSAVIEEDIKKIHYNDLKNCMNGIFNTLRKNQIDVKTHKQCYEAVNSLIFENESLKQRANCFDELHIELAKANSESFERECPSSLLDDCKHAINCLKTPAQNRSH